MRAIVVGAGEVGFHIAERLATEGHDITIIERNPDQERLLSDRINGLVVIGSGASPEVLERARIDRAALFIAVTDLDEVNLIACLMADQYGVPRKIARIKAIGADGSGGRLDPSRLGIDLLINPNTVVANELFNVVAYTAATEVAEFAEGRVVFLGYPITEDSPLSGVDLRELGEIRGMYRLVVTALRRGDQTVIPRGEDAIQAGDTLFFVCQRTDLPAIRYLFGLEAEKAKKVFLLGGGRVGTELAARLARFNYRVTVVDRNPEHCEKLARELEGIQVLNAGGTDLEALRQEGLDSADVFAAVTQDDKSNILCALLAKRLGVRRVVSLVNQPEFVNLAPSLGVDACISARLATAAAILKHVRRGQVLSMAMVEQGGAEVMELSLPSDSALLGQSLSDLKVPRGAIIGAIVRGEDVIIPMGTDHLEADDHVIVFTLPEAVPRVERFFAAR